MGLPAFLRRPAFPVSGFLVVLLVATVAMADDPPVPGLADFAAVFPGNVTFGSVEGDPPAIPVFLDGRPAGWVFSTATVVDSTGFSGKPLDVLVGMDRDGRLTGASLFAHSEPILLIGVSAEDLAVFVARYRDIDIRQPLAVVADGEAGTGQIDAVSGATVSAVVMNDAILRAARAVARSRGLFGEGPELDLEGYAPTGWQALVAEGSLVGRRVNAASAEAAVAAAGGSLYPPGAGPRNPDAGYVDVVAGLATPARVGRNLFGDRLFNRLRAEMSAGDHLLFVAGRGLWSFKGTAWRQGGVFDRLRLVQGDTTISFRRDDHERIDGLRTQDAPEFRELAVFRIAGDSGFHPEQPWRLEFLVSGRGPEAPVVVFGFDQRLPDRYRLAPPAELAEIESGPLWIDLWQAQVGAIVLLLCALVVLTGVLVFQDIIARNARLHLWLRTGFLVFTVVWLGWYTAAQLSVVNVLTFIDAILSGFRWELFLLEPLIFILWGWVAVALLFWGRGVFCGWLCPFGALQELSNRLARLCRVPQWSLPFGLHERLWPLKYVIFLLLLAVSLGNMTLALMGAEVEPFKTAIVLGFAREWPFVAFALGLLLGGLFIERFFCRYLCPLGASLAIPARLHMFEWLKRRWQCGSQCQQCAVSCPVQAIHPDGHINPNECIHCLKCQILYHDDEVCPPLIQRRKRRERREALASGEEVRTGGRMPLPDIEPD